MQSQIKRNDGAQLDNYPVNTKLFRLDLSNNPEMNIDDVLAIQESLLRNKQ